MKLGFFAGEYCEKCFQKDFKAADEMSMLMETSAEVDIQFSCPGNG